MYCTTGLSHMCSLKDTHVFASDYWTLYLVSSVSMSQALTSLVISSRGKLFQPFVINQWAASPVLCSQWHALTLKTQLRWKNLRSETIAHKCKQSLFLLTAVELMFASIIASFQTPPSVLYEIYIVNGSAKEKLTPPPKLKLNFPRPKVKQEMGGRL